VCEVENFADLGTPVPKKSYHDLGLSPRGQTNFGPALTTELPGHKPLIVNGVVVGPFEDEEEGTCVASDIIKVKGKDPATPGPLKRNDPGTAMIPQYQVNKTKQPTRAFAAFAGPLVF